jgi:uncharacterized protein YydD (DUF2326 family)
MILKEISSEPAGLFAHTKDNSGVVKFKIGVNYIYGKKEVDDATDSLNGIGKSLFLDFIDFALLSALSKGSNKRLFEAKDHLSGYKIVLKFKLADNHYTIKRSFDDHNEIEFGKDKELEKFTKVSEAKQLLCDILFKRQDYSGKFSNSWFRRLISFFLKIHKSSDDRFSDPIKFLVGTSLQEINIYHLFLLDIDNSLSFKSNKLQDEISKKTPILNNIESIIKDTYGLKKINEAQNKIDLMKKEIKSLEEAVKRFELAKKYKSTEIDADRITQEIKEKVVQNYNDLNTINQYKESYEKSDVDISTRRIRNLYKEFNKILAEGIKKELDDAIEFRKKIAESRKQFLEKEIERLEDNIKNRDLEIEKLDKERKEIFNFLSVKKAIKDLTTAQAEINKKKEAIYDLEGRTKIHSDLSKEILKLKAELSALDVKVNEFITDIQDKVSYFREIFTDIYNHIYPESKNTSIFSIHEPESNRIERKINIDISFPAMRSEGKNQGRTLVYDLSVLIHGLKKDINLPRFLVHDGIFDGVDKAHFVATCNYINEVIESGIEFQYILPINEEGTLNQRFGEVDNLTAEKIEDDAIIVLTPQKKLLGKSWD